LGFRRPLACGKLLELPIVRDVRSNIAIQSLKADAPLPLGHFDADGK
jgi:Lrp/AsnC family leucine-responsive transcriptional regulator